MNFILFYFPKISEHLPKISEDFPKLFRIPDERSRTFSEYFRKFPKMSEDFRRLSKTSVEDPMFRWFTDEVKYNLRDKPDVIERYDTHKGDIRKYATRVPDEVAYGIYEWFSSQ